MSRSRPGWKHPHTTLWTWGAYTVRRQSIDRSIRITHMARLNGVELAGRDCLVDAQRYCEQHAARRSCPNCGALDGGHTLTCTAITREVSA